MCLQAGALGIRPESGAPLLVVLMRLCWQERFKSRTGFVLFPMALLTLEI